jgi:hypothetical protein
MDKDEKRIRPSRRKNADETLDKMQPVTPRTDEVDLLSLDEQYQEHVTEKLSISVPVAPLPKRAQPFWGRYLGTKVLLLLKDGTEIGGILREVMWDFIRLENFLEVGRNRRGSASWVMVDATDVARIYPANAQFEHNG